MDSVKGSIWAMRVWLLWVFAQEVAAHHFVGEGLQGVGVEVVALHPVFEVADQAVHVAFHGEVLVGDVELLGAHQPQFVEVGDVDDEVGFGGSPASSRSARHPCRAWPGGRRQSAGSGAVLARRPARPRIGLRTFLTASLR